MSSLGPHRLEYSKGTLDVDQLDPDPIQQFLKWFRDARDAGNLEPSAMTLATVGADGRPHARMVLLKAADDRGFVFATHFNSPKGRDLATNPSTALVFFWPETQRQVRIEGPCTRLEAADNAALFTSRPKEAQVAASLGGQSMPVADRATLHALFREAIERFANSDVPAPIETWGGYALRPETIEFWQGGLHRLHDRLRCSRQESGAWKVERLMP